MPFFINADDFVNFHKNKNPLYFYVPKEINTFTIIVKGYGSKNSKERARIKLYDPEENLIKNLDTLEDPMGKAQNSKYIIKNNSQDSGIWTLIPSPMEDYYFEDYSIKLGNELPQNITPVKNWATLLKK